MAKCKKAKMNRKESDQKNSMGGLHRAPVDRHPGAFDLALSQSHFQYIEQSDHNIFRPVQKQNR